MRAGTPMSMLGRTGRVTRNGRRSALVVVIGLLSNRWVGSRKRRAASTIADLLRLTTELRDQLDAERRRADELVAELERVRTSFALAMARVNDLFWTVEVLPDGELTLTHASADASGVVGRNVSAGLDVAAFRASQGHPDDVEASTAFTAAIRAGEPAEVEERLIGLDGVTRWTWSRGIPRREGGRLFFDGITTNVTERHELAEQREALIKREREQIAMLEEMHHSRDDFIALAGHELRTPLTVIQGYAEHLLEDPSMGDEQRQHLEVVVRRAGLMSDLIDDLFDLAKLDTRAESLEHDRVRLDELVEQSVEEQRAAADGNGLVLCLESDPVVVLGERRRLRRMVDQVLENAVRYSLSGGVVSVRVGSADGDAVVSITDQGIGIPPEEVSRVFDRLFRGSNAVEGQFPGTGLGLSSALAIAEGHGGTVEVQPRAEGGTVLTIRLPAI